MVLLARFVDRFGKGVRVSARDALIGELVAGMASDSATLGQAVDLILVVQSIERVGDHDALADAGHT